jgi:hypothetical protein
MYRLPAILAFALMGAAALAAQDAQMPPDAADAAASEISDKGMTGSPYKQGDQAISLDADASVPIIIIGGTETAGLSVGAGFGFSYRYFLDSAWSIGGSVSGAFNGTRSGRSLFIAPLAAELSYWRALVPFEGFATFGLGSYISRLANYGMIGPYASLGLALLWQTGSGWSVGGKVTGQVIPEIHISSYSGLTRTGLSLQTGFIAVYHL